MFETTPLKAARVGGQEDAARAPSRPADRRRPSGARPALRENSRVFDILAVWDGNLGALREQVDIVSSWGPYELFECIPLFEGKDGRQRVLCRFVYHGAASDHFSPNAQAQFKYALVNCLCQITEWEDVAGQQHVNAAPG